MSVGRQHIHMPPDVHIRPFLDTDAAAVAALITRLRPHTPFGPSELLSLDRDQRDLSYTYGRLVALDGDNLLGFAAWSQSPGQFHPRKWLADVLVDGTVRGQGTGTALYAAMEANLQPLGPISTRGQVSEADGQALAFVSARGYREDRRYWTSQLDLSAFDFAAYADLEGQLARQGVTLTTAADLARQDPAGWQTRLHTLFAELRLDVPRSEPPTPIGLEHFTRFVLEDPGFVPEAYVLAEVDGELIGQSDLYRSEASPAWMVGLTAVRRDWRGRSVALAMKLRAMRHASEQGVATILTDNESGNAPMLAVNDRLGFFRAPALLSVVKTWDT